MNIQACSHRLEQNNCSPNLCSQNFGEVSFDMRVPAKERYANLTNITFNL